MTPKARDITEHRRAGEELAKSKAMLQAGISHLVHEQRRQGGPKIKFDSDVQFKRLPSILENALYRIAQEALTNACKYSKSKQRAALVTARTLSHPPTRSSRPTPLKGAFKSV